MKLNGHWENAVCATFKLHYIHIKVITTHTIRFWIQSTRRKNASHRKNCPGRDVPSTSQLIQFQNELCSSSRITMRLHKNPSKKYVILLKRQPIN
jgi:hypothetical protein